MVDTYRTLAPGTTFRSSSVSWATEHFLGKSFGRMKGQWSLAELSSYMTYRDYWPMKYPNCDNPVPLSRFPQMVWLETPPLVLPGGSTSSTIELDLVYHTYTKRKPSARHSLFVHRLIEAGLPSVVLLVARMLSKVPEGSEFTSQATIRLVAAAVLLVLHVAGTGSASSVHSTEHATDARSRSVWHGSAPVEDSTPRVSSEVSEPGRGSFDKAEAASHQPKHQQRLGESDGASPLSFTSSNLYPAVVWSPWEQLAEPYREAVLVANSTLGDPEHDLFMWTLPTENGATYEGRWVWVCFRLRTN